jgi:hypothetical protein
MSSLNPDTFIKTIIIILMSSYCDYYYGQYCSLQCCDYSGYCPTYYSSCYYYYNSYYSSTSITSLSTGGIAGLAVGLTVFFIVLAIGIYCCRRRQQMNLLAAQSSALANNSTTVINVPNQGTAVYPQPVYQQPMPAYQQPMQAYPQPYGGADVYQQQQMGYANPGPTPFYPAQQPLY